VVTEAGGVFHIRGVPGPGPSIPASPTSMIAIRRALVALGVAGCVAAILRLRGTGGTPPQSGGWRELSGPDLR
jgi:hypothetical protein